MTRPTYTPPETPPPLDWVLVANAARARCFVRDSENGAMRELEAFVHPESRMKGEDLMRDRGGKAVKGMVSSTQYAPHTDPHEREHEVFARQLADYLDKAALDHRMPGVSVIATNPFLGTLKAQLGSATQRVLRAAIALDLTALEGAELEGRVTDALGSSPT
jgi:protein required for attachment to host cells